MSGFCEGQWSRGSCGSARAELGSWGLSHHPARSRTPGTRVAQAPPQGWGWAKDRPGCGSALLWGAGEQPSCGVAGAGADGLKGLTWDPGPWVSGGNPRVSRGSQTCGCPWAQMLDGSGFLLCIFWKYIYFCQVPWCSGDMKWCRMQFVLHYCTTKKTKTNEHQSFII